MTNKTTVLIFDNLDHYENTLEDREIMKMVEQRDKRDNGKRYNLEDVKRMIEFGL